jgi:molecular chaperone HtpG
MRSLKQVAADFRPSQSEIYYLAGESVERLRANPKLEAAKARGIEVLLLADPIDAFWTVLPQEFEGKKLKSLSQGDVDFGSVPLTDEAKDKESTAPDDKDATAIVKAVKEALGEQVSDVRASQRLTDSASCLVAGAGARDRELERLLARNNRGSGAKPILELNLKHALVQALATADRDGKKEKVADLAALLLDQAHILDGEVPTDPAGFVRRVNKFIIRHMSS